MLYHRYASPKELLSLYIEQGRFGELVNEIIVAENKRVMEEAEAENERKYWELYLHSFSGKSYSDWRKEALGNSDQKSHKSKDTEMTSDDIDSILKHLFKGKK